jgi:hypothetical protein
MAMTVRDIILDADAFRRAYPNWPHAEPQPDPHAGCCLPLPQEQALRALCARYNVDYDAGHYKPSFDLPAGYVAGWVGGHAIQATRPTIYVGCSPEGAISS